MTDFNKKKGMEVLLNLSDEGKAAYVGALVFLTKVDGATDENEKSFLKDVAEFHGMDDDVINEIFGFEDQSFVLESLKNIKDRSVALELIKDMCFLSHRDDELSDEEVLFIGDAGNAMGVEIEKIEEISRWVIDRIIWLEEEKLIFEKV